MTAISSWCERNAACGDEARRLNARSDGQPARFYWTRGARARRTTDAMASSQRGSTISRRGTRAARVARRRPVRGLPDQTGDAASSPARTRGSSAIAGVSRTAEHAQPRAR